MDRICPFCERLKSDGVARSGAAAAFPDAFPLSEGHSLVVPIRHEPDFFALSTSEQDDLWRMVGSVRARLAAEFHPDGFNVGLNSGRAAGQTVDHAHIHVIPRFTGDVVDPRGGIRWVLSDKAVYWT